MWQFVVANWWMFLIAIAILFGAVFLVIYGVVTQYDRGLMKRDGKLLKWERKDLPLRVQYDSQVPPSYLADLSATILKINAIVRKAVFHPQLTSFDQVTTLGPTHILVVLSSPHASGGEADIRYDVRNGRLMAVTVKLRPDMTGQTRLTAIEHEMGHALGLDHDDKTMSVMHPKVSERAQAFTKKDQELLRKLYG
jgi:hypothetical protein